MEMLHALFFVLGCVAIFISSAFVVIEYLSERKKDVPNFNFAKKVYFVFLLAIVEVIMSFSPVLLLSIVGVGCLYYFVKITCAIFGFNFDGIQISFEKS